MNAALKGLSTHTRVLLRLTQTTTRTLTTRLVLNVAFESKCSESVSRPARRALCTSAAPMADGVIDVHLGKECLKIPGILGDMNYTWLRENCPCPSCYNRESYQIMVHSHHLDADIRPHSATHSNGGLQLVWPDGHASNFDVEWLKEKSAPPPMKPKTSRIHWGRELKFEELPRVNVDDYMNSDDGVKELLRSVLTYGVGIVDGMPPTMAWTSKVGARFSHIQPTIYGGMMDELSGLGNNSDLAYTNDALGAHTDVPYFRQQLGIVLIHGVVTAQEGGHSYLIDGFNIAEQLRTNQPDQFDLLSTVRVPFRSKATKGNIRDFYSHELTIGLDPVTNDLESVRYNHYDRSPLNTIPHTEMAAFYEALNTFSRGVEDPRNQMRFLLPPGSVVFIDNFRVLHARTAFKGRRILYSCYLSRDEPRSYARLLGLL